jgi:hypothetical protein
MERLDTGNISSLGACGDNSKRRESFSRKRNLERIIERGGPIPDSVSFYLPLLGQLEPSDKLGVRWKENNIVVLGVEPDLQEFFDKPKSGSIATVVNDDSFVSRYKQTLQHPTGFISVMRSDFQSSQTFLSKIVTLPIVISGTVHQHQLIMNVSISFEPLDARILQDISRDFSPAEGSLPIRASAGSASIRIGDNRVKQYVSFADAFILNRLIGGLSLLDLESPTRALRANFARYILFKVGLEDDSAPRPSRSLAEQPMQIILLDDTRQAITPSTAVAVKFESVQAARSFLCDEPRELQRLFDKRILLNAIRTVKAEVEAVEDPTDYKDSLKEALSTLLGEAEWDRYSTTYEIDPLLATVKLADSAPKAGSDGCKADITGFLIGGKKRDIHFLSPPTSEAVANFYYRTPNIIAEEHERAADLSKQQTELLSELSRLPLRAAGCEMALKLLGRAASELSTLPGDSPPPDSLRQLRSAAEKAKVKFDFQDWQTVDDVKSNLLDGTFERAIRRRIDAIADRKVTLTDNIIDTRVQHAVSSRRPSEVLERFSGDNPRIVSFVDQEQRVLYIANDLDALKRGVEQANATSPDRVSTAEARIRFYANGDNTVQSILDLSLDASQAIQADRWRTAKQEGPLLPFGIGLVGISGQNNGVLISARVTRELPKEQAR